LAVVDYSRLGPATPAAATDGPAPLADIRAFVHQFFVHGIPYEEAMRYGAHVVPTLLDMLADPREAHAWPNIVLVLGMLGDERAVSPLIALIEQHPGGEIDAFQYDAKRHAILGLGYLVNKNGNQQALAYLRDGADPSSWVARGIAWTSPERETAAERDRDLSRMAIIGLGLSGHPSAAETLRALLTPTPTAAGREFRAHMSGVIWEALRANQRIADEGLATYYRTPTP
jgi:HEAT repeat protein